MKARSRLKIAVAALVCPLLLSISNTAAAEITTNLTIASCLHLTRDGQKYSLSYFGQKCTHHGYAQLPWDQYGALASWAYNASHAKILSQLDRYKIFARLSTLDLAGAKGFSLGPCSVGPWADYMWASHAAHAVYGVSGTLDQSPLVTNSLAQPLLKLGLAREDRYFILRFKDSKKLSDAKRSGLARVFSD